MSEQIKTPEGRGSNVTIRVRFMRHGERDGSALIELGREITRTKARESDIAPDEYDAIKAIGSNAGADQAGALVDGRMMGRSLETAHIFAKALPGRTRHVTRERVELDYNTIVSEPPYDHLRIYNANLPTNFSELTGDERVRAAKRAQDAVMNHAFHVLTAEQDADGPMHRYAKESAGAFAHVIQHYARMTSRLASGSRILFPAGTHGGSMEWLLQQALSWTDTDGHKHIGFDSISDIGGGFNPSESYSIDIKTDANGVLQDFVVSFDDPKRPLLGNMHIDVEKLGKLAEFYRSLHHN